MIKVEHLTKEYVLRHQTQSYTALRDVISEKARGLFSKNEKQVETFKALNDVSFEIQQGERVGIIGRNGAGKSTLLKVLSRIVSPSAGRITMDGRVSSLLEVGTGFHPELSGRENIFLNGAILGMSKSEIKKRFDEIVAFSEVEQFLDTPVKRYSSGMYVRLAFAVAAHLEPEILIVDEVLAVGDAQFQKKCIGKMKDVSGSGRTVLFVSHNMGAISSLCDRGILLNKGSVEFDGSAQGAVERYLIRLNQGTGDGELAQRTDRTGNGKFRFTSVAMKDRQNKHIEEVFSGDFLKLEFGFEAAENLDLSKMIFSVVFNDDFQNPALAFVSDEMVTDFSALKRGHPLILEIPELLLRGNNYSISLFASYGDTSVDAVCDNISHATTVNVLPSDFYGSGKTTRSGHYGINKANYSA
ncbi:MAG: ATP-binding cassette domain-containing protein [Flavobacteriales bacterium]|nr:ATP-binding cassette domain-containing protein [Flavobacteriales bacterium]